MQRRRLTATRPQIRLEENSISSLPTEVGRLTNLKRLRLYTNGLTTLPAEIASLGSLTLLGVGQNSLTSFPTEFRDFSPSDGCFLANNPSFSCANVGFDTSCCTNANCGGNTATCYTG